MCIYRKLCSPRACSSEQSTSEASAGWHGLAEGGILWITLPRTERDTAWIGNGCFPPLASIASCKPLALSLMVPAVTPLWLGLTRTCSCSKAGLGWGSSKPSGLFLGCSCHFFIDSLRKMQGSASEPSWERKSVFLGQGGNLLGWRMLMCGFVTHSR